MQYSQNTTDTISRTTLSALSARFSNKDMTRTDRLPIDQLVQKLRAERQQRALKDRCLCMISHELRTPLASIQLSHDLLARYSEQATEEERQQYLDNIRQQVAHLNDIVSDVLNLSKSSHADLDFKPMRGDLVTLCRDICESFHLNCFHSHQFVFHCPEVKIEAVYDERLLRRALANLVGNAVKYSPDGGRIEVALWRDGDLACISVSDDGIGIPDEDADCLFLAFHRASNVDALPGTGLGLAIAKQALELHGGDIGFTSELGVGTTFEVTLPLNLPTDGSPNARQPQLRNSAKIGA